MATAKAHIASFGETRKRFDQAAARANENPGLREKVAWKSVQDRFKRLQEVHTKRDRWNQRASGVGGEVGEMEEVLSSMRESKEDIKEKRYADRKEATRVEAEKERMGQVLVLKATKQKSPDDGDVVDVRPRPEKETRSESKASVGTDILGYMDKFGKYLHDADIARIELEREKMKMDEERYQSELEARRKDREENSKNNLENMRLLIDAFPK